MSSEAQPLVCFESPELFCELIRKQVERGCGFMPLLGGGISAMSGIPTTRSFPSYFTHCLELLLARTRQSGRESPGAAHSPLLEWPEFAVVKDLPQAQDLRAWQAQLWSQICQKHGPMEQASANLKQASHGTPNSSERQAQAGESFVFLENLKNWSADSHKTGTPLAEWRLGLECIARLFNSGDLLGFRDERIIDAFFSHLTEGRRPNLGHLMLAQLADALRIHTVLTTNFDTLTEDAFGELKMPLATFDVHRRAGLPDPQLVLNQRAIVKLHGGRFGLRADDSLNEPPALQGPDVAVFRSYFQNTLDAAPGTIRPCRKHLLVLGASCSEERTVGFLRDALQHIPDLCFYWVCHSEKDRAELARHLTVPSGQAGPSARVFATVHQDLGLLLFQLYQHLYHALPPAGADYPAFWRVPPEPYRDENATIREGLDAESAGIARQVASACDQSAGEHLLVVDGFRGPSSVCARVWEELKADHYCLWLELDDFISPGDVFITLLREVALRVGRHFAGPFYPRITPERCSQELNECVRETHRKFVVFLNGRDGPGRSAGWESPDVTGVAQEQQPSSRWSAAQEAEFWTFLQQLLEPPPPLAGESSAGALETPAAAWLKDFVFVVLVRQPPTASPAQPSPPGAPLPPVPEPGTTPFAVPDSVRAAHIEVKTRISFNFEKILNSIRQWLNQPEDPGPASLASTDWNGGSGASESDWVVEPRLRFLYAITLFRHSRPPAAIYSWPLMKAVAQLSKEKDNDEERFKQGSAWLERLAREGVVRKKTGGFIWMHRNVRDGLRGELELREPKLKGLRAECHKGIADWYMKLFRSSNDPLAALESLYHRLCCIEFADKSRIDEQCGDPEHLKETAFIEAITTLKLAQQRILSCGYLAASLNLIRQITQATSRIGIPRATEFNRMCKETLRDFAREAADFRMAFCFNDQLQDATRLAGRRAAAAPGQPRSEPDLQLLDSSYYEAVVLTGLRSYHRAEDKLHELLGQLGFPEVQAANRWQEYGILDMRKMGRTWARLHKEDEPVLKLAIRACRRLMFLEMLLAQAFEYRDTQRKLLPQKGQAPAEEPGSTQTQLRCYAESIYGLATEIMRYVDDHEFLQVENAYIRTMYGVLLANLGRYWEAHRRLNEASGYMAHSRKVTDGVALGVVDLRKTETYLLQAERQLTPPEHTACTSSPGALAPLSSSSCQQMLAFLEDAHACLVRAQSHFDGPERADIWWLTLIRELKERICLCVASLRQRAPEAAQLGRPIFCHQEGCALCNLPLRTYIAATHLNVADPLRQARLTSLLLQFTNVVHLCPPPQAAGSGASQPDQQKGRQWRETARKELDQVQTFRAGEQFRRYPLHPVAGDFVQTVNKQLRS